MSKYFVAKIKWTIGHIIFVPNKWPTSAVQSMAIVLQTQIRITPFKTPDPPAFAATVPKMAIKIMEKQY